MAKTRIPSTGYYFDWQTNTLYMTYRFSVKANDMGSKEYNIYDQFSGIETTSLRNQETFPPSALTNSPARQRYSRSSTMTQFPGRNLSAGNQDAVRQEVVR